MTLPSIPTELLVAALALLGGWLLGGINYALRYRSDRRQRISRAIAVLKIINDLGDNYLRTSSAFRRGSKDNAQYEIFRSHNLEKMSNDLIKLQPYIDATIETVMDYDPLNISRFHTVIETSIGFSKRPLKASAQKPEIYNVLHTAIDATFRTKSRAERELIRSLALKIGPFFYLRTAISQAVEAKRTKKNLEASAPLFQSLEGAMGHLD